MCHFQIIEKGESVVTSTAKGLDTYLLLGLRCGMALKNNRQAQAGRWQIAEMTWKGVKLYEITGNSRESTLYEEYSLTLLRNFSKARTRIKLQTNYLNYATYILVVCFRLGSESKHNGLGTLMMG
jgi:hypothetical protein